MKTTQSTKIMVFPFLCLSIIVYVFTMTSCEAQIPSKVTSVETFTDSLNRNNNTDQTSWHAELEKFAFKEGLVRPINQDTSTWFAVLEQFADPRFNNTAEQLKGKMYIQYHRLKNSYTSFSDDGKLISINWIPIVIKNKNLDSVKISDLTEENISPQGLHKTYQLNQNYTSTLKVLQNIGIKAPISKIKKAALLGIEYEHALVNPKGFLAHQSEYLYTMLHVWMIDTATSLQNDIPLGTYGNTIFDAWLLKIYKPNGDLLLSYQAKEPIRPEYLLQISNDERFILIGTVHNIGDNEGYEPKGPFILYDRNSKSTYILPAINTEDKQKYPDGVGDLAESKFTFSFFQLTYYNGPDIGTRFLIDPYKKILYYRHYPASTFSEIYTNKGIFISSVLPNGQIKNIDKFSQISF